MRICSSEVHCQGIRDGADDAVRVSDLLRSDLYAAVLIQIFKIIQVCYLQLLAAVGNFSSC